MGASKLFQRISLYFSSRIPNKKVKILQVSTVLTFVLHLGGSFYIFYTLIAPPRELLLALLGSATVAIGLALKDLVASLISGITLIVDPPFQVGDRVRFKGNLGEVKHIGLRAVRILTPEAQMITIPNMSFIDESVLCLNQGDLNLSTTTYFYISMDSDISKAQEIIRDIVMASRYIYLKKDVSIFVAQILKGPVVCLQLEVLAHVMDAKFEGRFTTELYVKIIPALLDVGIKFPREQAKIMKN